MKKESKTGRPKLPKGNAKTHVVRARVSAQEHSRLKAAAIRDGLKFSDWTRKILLGGAEDDIAAQ
jgi:hypothetical protein